MDPESAQQNFPTLPPCFLLYQKSLQKYSPALCQKELPRVQQTAKFFMFKFPLAAALRSIPASQTPRGMQPAPEPRIHAGKSSQVGIRVV